MNSGGDIKSLWIKKLVFRAENKCWKKVLLGGLIAKVLLYSIKQFSTPNVFNIFFNIFAKYFPMRLRLVT